jgi:hypothetical protein
VGPAFGHQGGAVGEHGGGRLLAAGVRFTQVTPVVVERGVRPGEELVAVVLGDAQQVGDGLQRQLGGEVHHQVDRLPGAGALLDAADDGKGPSLEVGLQGRQRPG